MCECTLCSMQDTQRYVTSAQNISYIFRKDFWFSSAQKSLTGIRPFPSIHSKHYSHRQKTHKAVCWKPLYPNILSCFPNQLLGGLHSLTLWWGLVATVQTQLKHLNITEQYYFCETSIFCNRTFPLHVILTRKKQTDLKKKKSRNVLSLSFIKYFFSPTCLFSTKIPLAFPQHHKQLWESAENVKGKWFFSEEFKHTQTHLDLSDTYS